MTLPERLKLILKENGMKQKDLAAALDLSPSYISGLLNDRNKAVSPTLAERIENRLGYSAHWVLTGEGCKSSARRGAPSLSPTHQRAIAHLERMTEPEARAVLAFIRSLRDVEDALKQ